MTEIRSDNSQQNTAATAPSARLAASRMFWQRWKAWIIGPILIAFSGVLLALGCDYATYLNQRIIEHFPHAPLFLLPFGFALFVYLVRRFFRGSQGSGIGQAVAAINDTDPTKKSNLLSLRIAFGKGILLIAGFFVGGSIGREGPAVQIGASIMHAFYGKDKPLSIENRRNLITAGGAAGIAVAFNTPLAGIMFGIEELSKRFAFKEHTRTAFTVLLAILIAVFLIGDHHYFGVTHAYLGGVADFPIIVVCGVVGGAAGALFSRLMIMMATNPPRFLTGLLWGRPVLFAAACGMIVALLGMMTDGLIFGSGYDQTVTTLNAAGHRFDWFYGPIKFLATFVCGISGIPAGMFAPSISVGAGLGDTISYFLPAIGPHASIIVLMMAAYLTGVMRTPLTALIIIMEMTAGFHLLLPMLATVLIANGVSKLITPELMYTAMAEKFLRT